MLVLVGSIEEFLLARIGEDEAAVAPLPNPIRSNLLATFDATRRVIALRLATLRRLRPGDEVSDYEMALWDVLTLLALPYGDHVEYWPAFEPTGHAEVDPAPSRRLLTRQPPAGTVARTQTEHDAYLRVAIDLAQAVAANSPTTSEEWVNTSIGVAGTAWSTEHSTEVVLSRALLAMTRLAIAAADRIARSGLDRIPTPTEVCAALEGMTNAPR